jgi:hypothetical protein
MSPLHEAELARQQARAWSERLGRLAATSAAISPEPASMQPNTLPSPLLARLSAILSHFRQRHQRRQHAADKLRANEFIMAP